MHILITGGTGFLGRPLVHHLASLGYACTVTTRDVARAQNSGLPASVRFVLPDELPNVDAVIHLAGESVVGLWTPAKKRAILTSRVEGTRRLVALLQRAKVKPHTLLAASAVGFYGDRPGEVLTEDAAPDPAHSFRAEVCAQWEAEANRANELGIRVVNLRIGNVMDPSGGFLGAVLPIFRLLGGVRLGNANAVLPWIPLADCVRLISFALANERWYGPLNLVHPERLTRADFAGGLARQLGRPNLLRLPSSLLRVTLGAFASALVDDQPVISEMVTAAGYRFSCVTWTDYLDLALGASAAAMACAPVGAR